MPPHGCWLAGTWACHSPSKPANAGPGSQAGIQGLRRAGGHDAHLSGRGLGRLGLGRYRRFCLLGLRLIAGHRQEGQPLGLPQNALASPPKRQILKIALKSGLVQTLFGMTNAI